LPIPALQPGVNEIPTVTVHAHAPAGTASPSAASWMDALPSAEPTAGMKAAAAEAAQTSAPAEPSAAARFLQGLAATAEAIPRGAVGGKVLDIANAALATPLNMIYGQPAGSAEAPMAPKPAPEGFRFMGLPDAFGQALAEQQAGHKQVQGEAPISSGIGEVTGALGTGLVAAPGLAFKGATTLPQTLPAVIDMAGSVGSYLARNAGFGAATSYAAGGSPVTGAEIGGGAAAVVPAIAAPLVAAGRTAYRTLAPVFSSAAQEASVAANLGRAVTPGEIQTSPVGPLSLVEATNNPAVAAKSDIAAAYNPAANTSLRTAQQQAVDAQIAKVGTPTTEAAASTTFGNTVRGARVLAGKEESRLWTVPALAVKEVTPTPIRESVGVALREMDPVLRDRMSGQLQALVNKLNRAGRTTVRDLNGIRSELERIARNSPDGTERSQARTLSDAFMEGMDRVPEIAGAPEWSYTPPPSYPGYAGPPRTPVTVPAVEPDPEIAAAYQAARDYTREMRTLFNDSKLAAVLKKAEGVYRMRPSDAAQTFFDFADGGPEGAQTITQLADFIENLKAQPGASKIAITLRDSARAYIAAALSDASRLGAGKAFSPAAMIQFLDKNKAWIASSGLFERPQVEAWQQLLEYGEMLRRPAQLLREVGSATQPRGVRAQSFIDQIMTPWIRRLGELVMTGAAAQLHGGVGAALSFMASGGFETAVMKAENAMRTTMAAALFDAQGAKDLLLKATANNARRLAPGTVKLLTQLRLAAGSDVAPHVIGASQSPALVVQPGQQPTEVRGQPSP
jgi:hypothetical protein